MCANIYCIRLCFVLQRTLWISLRTTQILNFISRHGLVYIRPKFTKRQPQIQKQKQWAAHCSKILNILFFLINTTHLIFYTKTATETIGPRISSS